jgi:hypothetical protein
MFDLYKQQYKKCLGECKKFFDNRNKGHDNPINVISNIKPNLIEQGFKAALSTGHWIRRQGVAQVLQRLTYLQTICFLRRIDAPGGDASSGKLTGPRQLHPSQIPFLCCVTGDTEILQGDNASVKLISDMKNGDNVMSTYKDDLREMPTVIKNYFSKKDQELLEISTITGRTLKCTKDHPLLVRTSENVYEMINAENIKVGDQVIIRHFQSYIPLNFTQSVIIKSVDINKNTKSENKIETIANNNDNNNNTNNYISSLKELESKRSNSPRTYSSFSYFISF